MRTEKKHTEQAAALPMQHSLPTRPKPYGQKCTCAAGRPPAAVRRLKVQPRYVPLAYRNHSMVPVITLQGQWLRKLGFECQCHVTVIQEPGQLLIRLEKG